MSTELTFEQKTTLSQRRITDLYKELQIIHKAAKAVEEDQAHFSSFRGKYHAVAGLTKQLVEEWDALYTMYVVNGKEKEFTLDEKYLKNARSMGYECCSIYEDVIHPITVRGQSTSSPQIDPNVSIVQSISATSARNRLPKIAIPTFGGELIDWVRYRDVFTSLVHSEESLTPIEKFHHLIGSLSGEPRRMVSSFNISEVNYTNAWKALNARYDNKRILASYYLRRIKQFSPSSQSASNPAYLREFLKTVVDSFTSLSSLEIPNEADYLKLQLALDCLDSANRQLYEEKQHGEDFPTYESLVQFITKRCQVLELSEPVLHPKRQPKVMTTFEQKAEVNSSSDRQNASSPVCTNCTKDHLLFRCYAFLAWNPTKRMQFVREKRICYNCLRLGHSVVTCQSKYTCKHCKGRHHSLLHDASVRENREGHTSPREQPASHPTGVIGATSGQNNVLLGTAMANIKDWKGDLHCLRMVIDTGSQFSIITEGCARKLGLTRISSRQALSGVGLTKLPSSKGKVHCTIASKIPERQILEVDALVMTSITSNLPTGAVDPYIMSAFRGVDLADDTFWESRPIEFLLGSDLFFKILTNEPRIIASDNFGTLPTIFGHIVIGNLPSTAMLETKTCLAITAEPLTDDMLKSFWEIEEVASVNKTHPDDIQCENIFATNVKRESDGRYSVALPLRDPDARFYGSFSFALRRFHNLEAKLSRQPFLKEPYVNFMAEYLTLDHMEKAKREAFYVIPHHAVFKAPTAETDGKIRVVFDASMETTNGSLNQNLFIGPKLQTDISSIIMNFRLHKVVFCTDIVKMFRQILILPEYRQFQHILWRPSPDQALERYELKTLTYGQSSSPYLALRVLRQLADDEGSAYPTAARVLRHDVYVDDIITGANSINEALKLKSELVTLLKLGGFPVHKWSSNSPEFMSTVPTINGETKVCLQPEGPVIKVLGMYWDSKLDAFTFSVTPNEAKERTKRAMLSTIARLFDPMGFLSPIIFSAKCMIQALWCQKLDWDDPVPAPIANAWERFVEALPMVGSITISRWIRSVGSTLSLFGFCDASEKGYAAVIYLQINRPESQTETHLLVAKSRVAPIKTISIPRMELCGAHLLTKLFHSLEEFRLANGINNVHLFTDSTIVLSWLQISSQQLKTFVAHRIGYILTHTTIPQWNHVPSAQNPADLASRGMSPSDLISCDLWWKGPYWINEIPLILPPTPAAICDLPECKVPVQVIATLESPPTSIVSSLIDRFSDLLPLIRTLAYVQRFIHNARSPLERRQGTLTAAELLNSKNTLIRETQLEYLHADFNFQTKTSRSLRFRALNVKEDHDRVLRVGGRLAHASIPDESKHPILLPTDAKLTSMIIDHLHRQFFHLGPTALQACLQRQYYIFGIKNLIKKQVWKCIRCFKLKATPHNPFMADLPTHRVSQGRPFISVGVDFAGPFGIKLSARRNCPTTKAYLCLFVCMATKAVHLELVTSLTTDAFLATFDRFVARRGLPTDVFSDCGTNFVGAARKLRELYAWINRSNTKDSIGRHSSQMGVNWHFNPPSAPHFGGLWEAAVKSTKSHLHRTLGDRSFNFEELSTIFARVEAVLNSRPLCPVSSTPGSFDYLTPGHFIIGAALISPPDQHVSDNRQHYLRRWQMVQQSVQQFWKRWSQDYLHTLQRRSKWTRQVPGICVDDLVLIMDSNVAPLHWRMGRVVQLHPGPDGTTRVITLRTTNGLLTRPVHKVAPLDPLNHKN